MVKIMSAINVCASANQQKLRIDRIRVNKVRIAVSNKSMMFYCPLFDISERKLNVLWQPFGKKKIRRDDYNRKGFK